MKDSLEVIKLIQEKVKDYLIKCNIKSLVIGVSGGFDSGFGCAVLAPVCKDLNIPLIGKYIHVESNSDEEKTRAIAIGNEFCTSFNDEDLTQEYKQFLTKVENPTTSTTEQRDKIRRGNVKVRMRIMYLYYIAQESNGIVVGCNNATENELGFFTLGDSGDIQPFISLYKTDLYEMAKDYLQTLTKDSEKAALQSVIDAVPTDNGTTDKIVTGNLFFLHNLNNHGISRNVF